MILNNTIEKGKEGEEVKRCSNKDIYSENYHKILPMLENVQIRNLVLKSPDDYRNFIDSIPLLKQKGNSIKIKMHCILSDEEDIEMKFIYK